MILHHCKQTVRGAPAIGATAAYGMALAALLRLKNLPNVSKIELLSELKTIKNKLDAARPTAVNLAWATSRILDLAVTISERDTISSAQMAEYRIIAGIIILKVCTCRGTGLS